MSQNNLDYAEQVKTAVEHIRSTTDETGSSSNKGSLLIFVLLELN